MSKLKLYAKPVHDIDLDEPPDARWAGFATRHGDAIRSILDDVEEHIDEEILPNLSYSLRTVVKSLASGAGRFTNWLLSQFGKEEYPQELQCIAEHVEIPVGKLLLGNLIYDMTSLSEMYGCGCSSASFDVDGSPVLVRNMDWVVPPTTGKHTVLIRFHKGNKSYLSVGVAGMVGVVSAMCSSWAVVVNQAPVVTAYEDDWWTGLVSAPQYLYAWPALQRVRAVCDKMPSYEKLVFHLRTQQTMVPFFAHTVGTQSKEHAVVAHAGEYTYLRTKKHGLVQTNHYVNGELKQHNPENGEDWEWDTYPRYASLLQACKSSMPAAAEVKDNPAIALGLLKDVTNEDTMQQMLLWPSAEKLVLKTRG